MIDLARIMFDFKGVTAGGVIGAVSDNGISKVSVFGTLDRNTRRVTEKTIYDCASLTKSVVTTTLLHHFINQKEMSPDLPVKAVFPEAAWASDISFQDLITYSVDFGIRLSLLKNVSAAEIQKNIFIASVSKVEQGNFINATSLVLGWLLERISRQTLEKLAQEIIFDPLKMNDTSLMHSKDTERTAPSEVDDWRGGEVRGVVHDESAWVFAQESRAVGSAGLFSTVPDLLRFAEWKLNQLGTKIDFLGWEQNANWMPQFSDTIFGKSGFTGCGIIFMPEQKKGGSVVTECTVSQKTSR
jgi:CubicO group peptidase (beta-lactamase class C family)